MSLLYTYSHLNGVLTLTIYRPAVALNLRDGKPYSVTWNDTKVFFDVKALDLDILEKNPGCQCIIAFDNGLSALATPEVLSSAKIGYNSGTKHHCKVIQCSDLVLLEAEAVAA